ncbi:MAG: hypothetical protein ACFFEY_13620 [Candidatus Thorarchaeota archaeon]
MKEIDKLDKKLRNVSLLILLVASIVIVLWVIGYIKDSKTSSPLLMSIGIALLLSGILLLTRIQYVIWMKKRY